MNKQGGNAGITIIIFLAALATWALALIVVPWFSHFLTKDLGSCAAALTETCMNRLSAYGATGDIFGAATALFSGLALFAIALTLGQDIKARRESRKPFLIASLKTDAFLLENPDIGASKKISYSITVKVTNQTSDAALNVAIKGSIHFGGTTVKLKTHFLQQPLNGSSGEDAIFKGTLNSTETNALLVELTDTDRHATLHLEAQYMSLENVAWCTAAIYELRCENYGQREKLNAIRSDSDNHLTLWKNDAAVALDTCVQNGSWKHKKTK